MTLYTHARAASLLGLAGRASVAARIKRLANRGEPLTVEDGELLQVGARLLITEAGLERLRSYEPGRSTGRPQTDNPSPNTLAQRRWRARRKEAKENE